MNDLEKQLAKVIEKSLELAETTGTFVVEQAPDLLQQFYYWHTTKFILGIILGILFFILGRYLPMFWTKKMPVDYDLDTSFEMCFFGRVGDATGILPITFLWLTSLSLLIINIYNLIFILTAPKLYLIEYFL